MNPQNLVVFAQISAINARVEGMVAENQSSVVSGNRVTYTEDHFEDCANQLDSLAGEVSHGT